MTSPERAGQSQDERALTEKVGKWRPFFKDHFEILQGIENGLGNQENEARFLDGLKRSLHSLEHLIRERYGAAPVLSGGVVLIEGTYNLKSEVELEDWSLKLSLWETLQLAIHNAQEISRNKILAVNGDPHIFPAISALACMRAFPAILGMNMLKLPSERLKVCALAALTAWSSRRISLKKNKRLRSLIGRVSKDRFVALLQPAVLNVAGDATGTSLVVRLVEEGLAALIQKPSKGRARKGKRRTILSEIIHRLEADIKGDRPQKIPLRTQRVSNSESPFGAFPEPFLVQEEATHKLAQIEDRGETKKRFAEFEDIDEKAALTQRVEVARKKAKLTPRQERIFTLHYQRGMSSRKIARLLRLNSSTVSREIQKTVLKVKQALAL